MGYSFGLAAKVLLYNRMANTAAFVTPVVDQWLVREIAQWVHHEGSIRPELYLAVCNAVSNHHVIIIIIVVVIIIMIIAVVIIITIGVIVIVVIAIIIVIIIIVIILAAAGFLSRYLSGPLPYVRRHITINKMC